MTNVLVTGGLGFIGSHICVELLKRNFNVSIIDNLENSNYNTFTKIQTISKTYDIHKFSMHQIDLLNKNKVYEFFENNNIDIIIHCAGKKSVSESITIPLDYYNSNINMTINLLEMVKIYKIQTFIFSSSATVYGNHESNNYFSLGEHSKVGQHISNPYGKTKYIQEMILHDFYKLYTNLQCYILRYFNPVGCHPSGIIGENPNNIPNNIMPYLLRVAKNNNISSLSQDKIYNTLTIFGNDYQTPDGTCIRDFIHVCDVARAHIDVLTHKDDTNNVEIFNVGTGKGVSVLDLVKQFMYHNKIQIHYIVGDRRKGDEKITVCDNTKIVSLTEWRPVYSIKDIVMHSWNYIVNQCVHDK